MRASTSTLIYKKKKINFNWQIYQLFKYKLAINNLSINFITVANSYNSTKHAYVNQLIINMLINFTNELMICWNITNYFNDVSNLLTTIFLFVGNFSTNWILIDKFTNKLHFVINLSAHLYLVGKFSNIILALFTNQYTRRW